MRAGPLAGVHVQGGKGRELGEPGAGAHGLGEVCGVRKGKGEESLQGPRAGVQVQGGQKWGGYGTGAHGLGRGLCRDLARPTSRIALHQIARSHAPTSSPPPLPLCAGPCARNCSGTLPAALARYNVHVSMGWGGHLLECGHVSVWGTITSCHGVARMGKWRAGR